MPSPASVKQEPLQDDCSIYGSVVGSVDDSPDEEEKPLIVVGLVTNEKADSTVHSDELAMAPTSVSLHQKRWKITEESTAASDVIVTSTEVGLSPQMIRRPCPHCSETDLTEDEMQLHLQKHCEQEGQFYCGKCKFSTMDRIKFNNHARRHPDWPLQCPHCAYFSYRRSEYCVHLRDHSKDQPVECDQCGATLKTKRTLDEHCRRLHSDLVPLSCSLCSFSTLIPGSLAKHTQKHDTGKLILKCEECDFTSIDHSNLQRHKLVHREKEPLKILKCEECSFETKFYHTMVHHKNVHTEVRHNCMLCSFTTVYPNNLRQHMRLHEVEKLSCSLCSYQTARKDSLEVHMRRHNEGQRFNCKRCSFDSTYAANLRRHLIRVHHQVNPKIVTSLPGEKCPSKKERLRKMVASNGQANILNPSIEEKANYIKSSSQQVFSDGEVEANVLSLLPTDAKPNDGEGEAEIIIRSPGEEKVCNKRRRRVRPSSDGKGKSGIITVLPGDEIPSKKRCKRQRASSDREKDS